MAQHLGRQYRWRNLVADTSGYGGGVISSYLDPFDLGDDAVPRSALGPYHLWFLVPRRGGPPIAAIDAANDVGYFPGGRAFDFADGASAPDNFVHHLTTG